MAQKRSARTKSRKASFHKNKKGDRDYRRAPSVGRGRHDEKYLLAWSGVIVRDVISPRKAMLRGSEEERKEDGTWGGLSSEREIYWTRICVVLLAAFLAIFGIYYEMPESAFKFMYITGTIYFAGAVGAACRPNAHLFE